MRRYCQLAGAGGILCRHAHSLFASDYWVHINKVQPAQQIKMQYSGQEAEERKAICSILFYIYLVECSIALSSA